MFVLFYSDACKSNCDTSVIKIFLLKQRRGNIAKVKVNYVRVHCFDHSFGAREATPTIIDFAQDIT